MKSEDLDRIEHDLGIRLPADYRVAMLADPLTASQSWLVSDTEQLLELNATEASAWPSHLFLFAHLPTGQPLFLDLSATPPPVALVEPETGQLQLVAPDFATFLSTTPCLHGVIGLLAQGRAV